MSTIRDRLPWWVVIGAKLVLSRLSTPYSFWKWLHLFEHGDMDKPEMALAGFLEHARTAGVLDEQFPIPV